MGIDGTEIKRKKALTEKKAAKAKTREAEKLSGWVVLVAFLGIGLFIYYQISNPPSPESIMQDAEKTREEIIKAGFSGWDGSHIELTKIIKNAMNDPKSYEHDETMYWDMGENKIIISTSYRGKNAFGAVVKNWVKAEATDNGQVVKILETGH